MRLTASILLIVFFNSMTGQNNVFQTGKVERHNITDTILIEANSFIVLPINIGGKKRKFIFDTGADLIVAPDFDSTTLSSIKIKLTDSNGLKSDKNLHLIESIDLKGIKISEVFSIELDLPEPFRCYADGIIGNNLIKSLNWQISENYIIISNQKIKNKLKTHLKTFSFGSNRLHTNILINNTPIDTCLIDYGGIFEINLPVAMYSGNTLNIQENYKYTTVKSSYGANGISNPDTNLVVNCNLNFNGIDIKNVNITFSNNREKRIGINFLRRFQDVVINNKRNLISFGKLLKKRPIPKTLNCDFDLIAGNFFVNNVTLKNTQVNYGDTFISINNKSSDSFANYCEFLEWKQGLSKFEYLELVTKDGKEKRIKYWH